LARLSDIPVYLILLSASVTYFVVKTYGNAALFSATVAFAVMATTSLIASLYTASDEPYYEPLTLTDFLATLGTLGGMVAVGSLAVGAAGGSVLWYPRAFSSVSTSAGGASSVFTALLGELVYQLAVVASGEELLKFAAYTELKRRYGVPLAVAVSVGLWAAYHALQAYRSLIYILPAFVCGVLLVALLEYTRSLVAPVIAHGLYNTLVSAVGFASPGLPWLPPSLTSEDLILAGLASLWTALILLPVLVRR
jgi:membrane protease YdiL (CAAX protease family)